MRKACLLAGVCGVVCLLVSACLSRPVGTTEPHTNNLYVEPLRNRVVDKLDLLFMIDNSSSMGDKQALLAKAVPQLLTRLVVPRCVNGAGDIKQRASTAEACPAGYAPEFRAVGDVHVAVITSSLGSHGATSKVGLCPDASPTNDRAFLLPKARRDQALGSYDDTGFLAWDPLQKLTPPGERDAQHLGAQFGDMVKAAGEQGCGYEASLESWYRFLVDPEPPLTIGLDEKSHGVAQGVDEELLKQRHAFLRPDSLVAIVMLTDENDCSIRDDGYGYWAASNDPKRPTMPRATSACAKDPNDPCCMACIATGAIPASCPAPASDPACQAGDYLTHGEDSWDLRCLQNKRRFGYDFLYPTSRYVQGLSEPLVPRRSDGILVENPLFAAPAGTTRRNKDLIYLAGIVGVPWQDIADDASRSGAGLHYLSAGQLESSGRWNVIVGDASKNQPPTDPFMVESTKPRSGTNPVTGDPIVAETSLDPRASPINGHEQKDVNSDDLQYACTFKLADPVPCTDDKVCDCHVAGVTNSDELPRNRPLCQPEEGGPAEAKQYFGKAYPGLRPLEVLRGLGDSAIVASICPKVLTDGQPGYGYEPAVDAIVDRLKTALLGRCPPRPLAVSADASGELPCMVVEAAPSQGACSCVTPRRHAATAQAVDLVRNQLGERKECGVPGTPACSDFCFCELEQSQGVGLEQCLNDEAGSDTPGYCYVDPYGERPQGNPALVAGCGATQQLIRLVGPNTPQPGATAFIACLGATLH